MNSIYSLIKNDKEKLQLFYFANVKEKDCNTLLLCPCVHCLIKQSFQKHFFLKEQFVKNFLYLSCFGQKKEKVEIFKGREPLKDKEALEGASISTILK